MLSGKSTRPPVYLQDKNFFKIAVTHTKINVFLCFMHNFKMAAKNGGKIIFGKKCHMTLYILCEPKLSSIVHSCTIFEILNIFHFHR